MTILAGVVVSACLGLLSAMCWYVWFRAEQMEDAEERQKVARVGNLHRERAGATTAPAAGGGSHGEAA